MPEFNNTDSAWLNSISSIILGASISVHREMGPGLLESVYQHCLMLELRAKNLAIETLIPVPLSYKGTPIDKTYVIDILVESSIIVELKSVEILLPVHKAQLVSYLKLSDKRLGFLINFNVPVLKQGFHRFVNKF